MRTFLGSVVLGFDGFVLNMGDNVDIRKLRVILDISFPP